MENWKVINNTVRHYEVNELGDVRVKLTDVRKRSGEYRILKGSLYNNGYIYYKLDNKIRCSKHRLIAQYFIPNPQNKPQVNHIDGDKLNNDRSNLEWATAQENSRHAWDTGLQKISMDRINKVIALNKIETIDLETGIVYDSLKEACEAVNCNVSSVRVRIHNNEEKRFKYIDGGRYERNKLRIEKATIADDEQQ
jgi:hypothetical protein